MKDGNGLELWDGDWENGYLNVGGRKWVDYEDGLVVRKGDKRRLRNWVLRGGGEPPGCVEVVKGWLKWVWDVVSWVFGGLWSVMCWCASGLCDVIYWTGYGIGMCFVWIWKGICWCASGLWDEVKGWIDCLGPFVLVFPLILSIQFGKYLSRLGRWGWTCPMWYVVLVGIVWVCAANQWIWDSYNNEELYFACNNALLHAVSMASFHWLPNTFRSFVDYSNDGLVAVPVLLAVLGAVIHVLSYCLACHGEAHNLRYNTFHLLPIVGLVAVSYEESESSDFCLIWGIGILINGIVCLILCLNKKPNIPLAILWDSILLLTMALSTRSYSVTEITVSILLIIVNTVIQFAILYVT